MLLLYTETPTVFDQQNHRGQLECMKYTVPMCDEINIFITYSLLCHPYVKATKQSCQSMSIGETTPTDILTLYKNTHWMQTCHITINLRLVINNTIKYEMFCFLNSNGVCNSSIYEHVGQRWEIKAVVILTQTNLTQSNETNTASFVFISYPNIYKYS